MSIQNIGSEASRRTFLSFGVHGRAGCIEAKRLSVSGAVTLLSLTKTERLFCTKNEIHDVKGRTANKERRSF
jgi:hypothetical protein